MLPKISVPNNKKSNFFTSGGNPFVGVVRSFELIYAKNKLNKNNEINPRTTATRPITIIIADTDRLLGLSLDNFNKQYELLQKISDKLTEQNNSSSISPSDIISEVENNILEKKLEQSVVTETVEKVGVKATSSGIVKKLATKLGSGAVSTLEVFGGILSAVDPVIDVAITLDIIDSMYNSGLLIESTNQQKINSPARIGGIIPQDNFTEAGQPLEPLDMSKLKDMSVEELKQFKIDEREKNINRNMSPIDKLIQQKSTQKSSLFHHTSFNTTDNAFDKIIFNADIIKFIGNDLNSSEEKTSGYSKISYGRTSDRGTNVGGLKLQGKSVKSTSSRSASFNMSSDNNAIGSTPSPGGIITGDNSIGDAISGGGLNRNVGKEETASANRIIEYFVSKGWTADQAAGIAANIQAESNFKTNASGDGGLAYGLAQWHPDRQANFQTWAGKDIRDSSLEEQLGFIQYELTSGKETAAGDALKQATSPEMAAAIFDKKYERSDGRSTKTRMDLAKVYSGSNSDNVVETNNTSGNNVNNNSTDDSINSEPTIKNKTTPSSISIHQKTSDKLEASNNNEDVSIDNRLLKTFSGVA